MQKEIAKKYMDIVAACSIVHKNISKLGLLYSEDNLTDKSFTFEQMKLTEELLSQADNQLKTFIDANLELFVATVKSKSQIKGCRWDDIVFRFEYETIALPRLLAELKSCALGASHKHYIEALLKKEECLDI